MRIVGVGVVTFQPFGVSFPLEFAARTADTSGMEILGHVCNGVIVLDGNPNLPEGATVTVLYPGVPSAPPAVERKRVSFPLVRSTQPGSVHLTNERIAEILDEEDAAPRR
jgi:hypothetical protein